MDTLPYPWTQTLGQVLSSDPEGSTRVVGPRHWWNGALDVESLALASTRVAGAALGELTGRDFVVDAHRVASSFGSLKNLRVNGRSPEDFAPASRFYATADGWIRLHANYPHHRSALQKCLGARTIDEIGQVLLSGEASDWEARIVDGGGVASAVRTRQEWEESAMGRAAASGPWIDFSTTSGKGTRWKSTGDSARMPLHGLRVLDLTRVIAGPSATRVLGTLGADVLRVDPPQYPELPDQFIDTGFDKRSCLLDLKERVDRSLFDDLLRDCHLVVLGYRPGALDSMALEPEQLCDELPHLKVVALNAWGSGGPWEDHRGFDSIVQASSGISEMYRDAQGHPGALPVQALDHATGMGAIAAAAVLLFRDDYSVARLSLARTAHELMTFPRCDAMHQCDPRPMKPVTRSMACSPHGNLEYAAPVLTMTDHGTEFSMPPVNYGHSPAQWKDPV